MNEWKKLTDIQNRLKSVDSWTVDQCIATLDEVMESIRVKKEVLTKHLHTLQDLIDGI